MPSRGGTAGNRSNPTPLGLPHLFIRSAHSRSASIDSRMNLSCFAAFRTAESKKKVHDAQCRRCLLMKLSIQHGASEENDSERPVRF